LLPNKTYNDLSLGFSQLNIRTDDSPVTLYIQHPIPIPAPMDENKVGLKPLMLTKKARVHLILVYKNDSDVAHAGAKEDAEAATSS